MSACVHFHAHADGTHSKCSRGGSHENAVATAVTGANDDGHCEATGVVEGPIELVERRWEPSLRSKLCGSCGARTPIGDKVVGTAGLTVEAPLNVVH